MIEAYIDGAAVESRQELHEQLAERLALPSWYGKNLDALYDCLTEPGEELVLRLDHADALAPVLGGYAEAFLRVLYEAQCESGRFRYELCGEAEENDPPETGSEWL